MFSHIGILLSTIVFMNIFYFYMYHLPKMINTYKKAGSILQEEEVSILSERELFNNFEN